MAAFFWAVVAAGAIPVGDTSLASCKNEVQGTAVAHRLADLPDEIRNDLARMSYGDMADSGSTIMQTDAPTEAERHLPTSRFLHAVFVRNKWFVTAEVTMTTPRTYGYSRTKGGDFRRVQSLSFGGPPCEAIKAALKGVTSF